MCPTQSKVTSGILSPAASTARGSDRSSRTGHSGRPSHAPVPAARRTATGEQRRGRVPIRPRIWLSPDQVEHGPPADSCRRSELEVRHAGEGDDAAHRQPSPGSNTEARGAASHNARWPPAECPIVATRSRSIGKDARIAARWSSPAATSVKVAGHPPPERPPIRRAAPLRPAVRPRASIRAGAAHVRTRSRDVEGRR